MKILLIEDDKAISDLIKRGLEDDGKYKVIVAEEGNSGLEKALDEDLSLIIMDIMLPNMSGFDICRHVRSEGLMTPILMLTARDGMDDMIKGFEIGADDYLTKPFHFDELFARIKALIRRDCLLRGNTITIEDLEIDTNSRTVKLAGKKLTLGSREYTLLEALARNEGRPLSRETIQYKIWNNEDIMSNTVDVYIRMLRKKIDDNRPKKLIHTVYGFGYMIKKFEKQ